MYEKPYCGSRWLFVGQDGPKMGPDDPKMGQDDPKMGQDDPKMAPMTFCFEHVRKTVFYRVCKASRPLRRNNNSPGEYCECAGPTAKGRVRHIIWHRHGHGDFHSMTTAALAFSLGGPVQWVSHPLKNRPRLQQHGDPCVSCPLRQLLSPSPH
jgi:hypothetical protein